MHTPDNLRGKTAPRRNNSAQRNGVRVMLATGATLATLIGAQSLAFIEQPTEQAVEMPTQAQTTSGVVIVYKDNSTVVANAPAATTIAPTAAPPVTATPFVTPATRAASVTKAATSTPTATATNTATKTSTPTATATKITIATKAVVVQPAPRTRSSR